jgi:hypothetical protein
LRVTATLRQIQTTLQNYLLDPQCEPNNLVVETERVRSDIRLGVYANAYRARMVEAMAADYQVLKIYLGNEAFAALITAYIDANPSRYFSMRWVGSKLSEFIQQTPPYNQHLDLCELARFEWALCHAFDAQDKSPQSREYFAALAPEQWPDLMLQFAPSLQLVALQTNAPQLWTALNAGDAPPAISCAAIKQMWLIWRRQLKLMFRPIDTLEVIALEQFLHGGSFGGTCELLANHLPEEQVPTCAVGLLQQWLQDELIVAS